MTADDAPEHKASPNGLGTWRQDLMLAGMTLTRLPFARLLTEERLFDPADMARSVRAYPVVGAIVGLLQALAYLVLSHIGAPPLVAAIAALGLGAVLTGALHEDGLADFADGFGASDRTRALAIMRDSRVGSFGVVALILSFGLRAAALASLDTAGAVAALVAGAVLGRGGVVLLLSVLAPARRDGLGASVAEPPATSVAQGAGLAVLLAALAVGPWALVPVVTLAAVGLGLVGWAAWRRLGGFTGDVLGAVVQVIEILVLVGLACQWS